MRTPVLVINRHAHRILYDGARCLLPLEHIEPHLVTHTFGGVSGHDPLVFPHTTIANVFDDEQLAAVCGWIIEEHGIRRIIALHEATVLLAATLRTRFGLPGLDLATALRLREKVEMEALAAESVPGDMYHCDAIVERGRVTFASVSEYLARPADFGPGGMAGSMHLVDGPVNERILRLNGQVIGALGVDSAATHLEVVHTPDDELVFHDIAACPGGGGIARYLLRSRGVHIFEAAMRLEVGLPALPAGHPVGVGDTSTWGALGFYPGGAAGAGIDPARFATYGIAEHRHTAAAGSRDGRPRHGADYADRYIVNAADRASFLAAAARIRQAYTAGE